LSLTSGRRFFLPNFHNFDTIASMLKIRLQRVGRIHEPKFRLVLTDSKNSTKSGKFLEILGNYDARHGEDSVFKADRITYWISKGAQATGTVHNLLVSKKIISGKKVNVLPKKKPIAKEKAPEEAIVSKVEAKLEEKVESEHVVEETKSEEEAVVPAPEPEPQAEVTPAQ